LNFLFFVNFEYLLCYSLFIFNFIIRYQSFTLNKITLLIIEKILCLIITQHLFSLLIRHFIIIKQLLCVYRFTIIESLILFTVFLCAVILQNVLGVSWVKLWKVLFLWKVLHVLSVLLIFWQKIFQILRYFYAFFGFLSSSEAVSYAYAFLLKYLFKALKCYFISLSKSFL